MVLCFTHKIITQSFLAQVTVANSTSLLSRPNRFRGLFRKPFSVRAGKGASVSTTALNVVTSVATPAAPSVPSTPLRPQDTLRVSPEPPTTGGDSLQSPVSEYCVLDTDEEDLDELEVDSCGEQAEQMMQSHQQLLHGQTLLQSLEDQHLVCTRNGHDDGMVRY